MFSSVADSPDACSSCTHRTHQICTKDQLSGCIILIHSFSVGMEDRRGISWNASLWLSSTVYFLEFHSFSLLGQEANERAMDPINACGGVWVPFLDLADQVIRRYQGSCHTGFYMLNRLSKCSDSPPRPG